MMELRPHQAAAIEGARGALANGSSVVIQMPTGSGKTKTAVAMIAEEAGVVWFVCHRQEIERQVSAALTAAGVEHGIVSPRAKPDYGKRVQVVSVATLKRRMGELPAPDLVFWDECHHVAAKSWASIRETLVEAKHIGLTATPERLDGKGLREWFAELVVGPTIANLVAENYLAPFRYFAPSDPDLTAAKLQAGDYRKADLAKVMNTPVLIGDAVAEYRRNADGKRAVAFCASVEASIALVDRFNAEGIPARHVDGTTGAEDREAAIAALAAGEIKVLSNVEVFTEGFDLPGIEVAILLRPTKSPTLLLQMIGRALRYADGKVAVIMDHAGLHADHGLPDGDWHWSLDGGAAKARQATMGRGPRRCPECKEVRAERVEVCACGFEYPSGREIGEHDGVLTEVRGVVPEGYVTLAAFAKVIDAASTATVFKWKARGLPTHPGDRTLVPIDAGRAWVAANVKGALFGRKRSAPEAGCETQSSFARRHGVSASTVYKWLKNGLPKRGAHVLSSPADDWVAAHGILLTPRLKPRGEEKPLSIAEFAEVHQISTAEVETLVEFKVIDATRAGRVRNSARTNMAMFRAFRGKTSDKSIPLTQSIQVFGKAIGCSPKTIEEWVSVGLPVRRCFIPIQAGLEWVRDNRPDIVIPPEAWPSANDNRPIPTSDTKAA